MMRLHSKYEPLSRSHGFCTCTLDLEDGRGPETRLCLKKTTRSPCMAPARSKMRVIFDAASKITERGR